MKTALVISGGGSRGAFAVGAIEILLERGWQFDVISGTSTGALIASLASIGDIQTLLEIYTSVKTKDILRLNWRRLFRDAIYDTGPLEKLIRRVMNGERYNKLMSSSVITLLCRVGFQSGRTLYGSQKSFNGCDNIIPWNNFDEFVYTLLASTNEPILMPPVFVANEICFDGGVREVAPLQIVETLGVNRVVIIINSPIEPINIPCLSTSMFKTGPRAIDLMTTEICNDDIKIQNNNIEMIVIRPNVSLPGSALKFIPTEMQLLRDIGRECAGTILDKLI